MKTDPILLTTRDSKNVAVGDRGRRYNYSPVWHFIEDGSLQLCFPDEEPKAKRRYMTYSRSPGSKTPHHVTTRVWSCLCERPTRDPYHSLWSPLDTRALGQSVILNQDRRSTMAPGTHCFPGPLALPFLFLRDEYPGSCCLFFLQGQPLPGLAIPSDFNLMSPLPTP